MHAHSHTHTSSNMLQHTLHIYTCICISRQYTMYKHHYLCPPIILLLLNSLLPGCLLTEEMWAINTTDEYCIAQANTQIKNRGLVFAVPRPDTKLTARACQPTSLLCLCFGFTSLRRLGRAVQETDDQELCCQASTHLQCEICVNFTHYFQGSI